MANSVSIEQLSSQMQTVVGQLRNQCLQASTYVASTWVGDSVGRAAIQSALRVDSAKIDRLNSDLKMSVLNKTLAPEKWFAIAKTTSDDITAQSGYASGALS